MTEDLPPFDSERDCHECGTAPQHWRMRRWHPYCRRCGEKNGHGWAFQPPIDVDKLLAYFAGDAEQVERFLALVRDPR